MIEIFEGGAVPAYLDRTAAKLLAEGRAAYGRFGFAHASVVAMGEGEWVLATRVGTVRTTTLALALQARSFKVELHDGFLQVSSGEAMIEPHLRALADGSTFALADNSNLHFEKFHPFLDRSLLVTDAFSAKLAPTALPELCEELLAQ